MQSSDVSNIHDIVPAKEEKECPIVVVIGAIAKGNVGTVLRVLLRYVQLTQVNVDYTERMIKLSSYPLSAALTCAKLTHVFEEEWQVV